MQNFMKTLPATTAVAVAAIGAFAALSSQVFTVAPAVAVKAPVAAAAVAAPVKVAAAAVAAPVKLAATTAAAAVAAVKPAVEPALRFAAPALKFGSEEALRAKIKWAQPPGMPTTRLTRWTSGLTGKWKTMTSPR